MYITKNTNFINKWQSLNALGEFGLMNLSNSIGISKNNPTQLYKVEHPVPPQPKTQDATSYPLDKPASVITFPAWRPEVITAASWRQLCQKTRFNNMNG